MQVVLDDPAVSCVGLTDDNIVKPDVYTLVWLSDAASDSHQEPDSDSQQRGKQA